MRVLLEIFHQLEAGWPNVKTGRATGNNRGVLFDQDRSLGIDGLVFLFKVQKTNGQRSDMLPQFESLTHYLVIQYQEAFLVLVSVLAFLVDDLDVAVENELVDLLTMLLDKSDQVLEKGASELGGRLVFGKNRVVQHFLNQMILETCKKGFRIFLAILKAEKLAETIDGRVAAAAVVELYLDIGF